MPQDGVAYYGDNRRGLYARDRDGRYAVTASSGWNAEAEATLDAADEYRRLAELALARARSGESAPLEYHMYERRMDPASLAEATGIWRWRVRRHLRPRHFARLSQRLLRRYAEALGVGAEDLGRLP